MATAQCYARPATAQPTGELLRPALIRRAEECIWQVRHWAAAKEAACSTLTAEL